MRNRPAFPTRPTRLLLQVPASEPERRGESRNLEECLGRSKQRRRHRLARRELAVESDFADQWLPEFHREPRHGTRWNKKERRKEERLMCRERAGRISLRPPRATCRGMLRERLAAP